MKNGRKVIDRKSVRRTFFRNPFQMKWNEMMTKRKKNCVGKEKGEKRISTNRVAIICSSSSSTTAATNYNQTKLTVSQKCATIWQISVVQRTFGASQKTNSSEWVRWLDVDFRIWFSSHVPHRFLFRFIFFCSFVHFLSCCCCCCFVQMNSSFVFFFLSRFVSLATFVCASSGNLATARDEIHLNIYIEIWSHSDNRCLCERTIVSAICI